MKMSDYVIKVSDQNRILGHPIDALNMALIGYDADGDVPEGFMNVKFNEILSTKSIQPPEKIEYRIEGDVVVIDKYLAMAEYDDPRIAHKMNASFWLAQTDSTQLPDVIGLIQNIDEINAYRTELRKIAIEMPKVVENWPEKPETIWNVSGVPTMVSMRQAQQSLNDADLLELVESHFDTLPNSKRNRAIKIDWKKAKHVARNSDLVVSLAGVLSLDDSQVDAMFIDALNYPE